MNIQQHQRNHRLKVGLYLVGRLYNFVADNTAIAVLSATKLYTGPFVIRLAVEEIRTRLI